ncbi:MAG: helix-turn-helix domain-containing protein [Clostridium sp.]|uniref:helix-turn-helix domain-containing protein n=1 Tax=Clostridium culturomicium TaxID=1499683 RepID=UPI00058D35B7|nr:helix-turn-helix transcriptional regulator [Clostridium culturomicium]MDU4892725.1 helix-turn-helix domain-containing protein [Clostridium sp.]MDU7082050.1 helix-turn-helix domain-containing protein [Clostridium sp.]
MEILSLGEKIKQRRKELDLTLKNLAGDRITAGQISLIESGKSNPSMDLLEYLASTLKVSVEHLMETEETQANKICTYYENIAEACILNGHLEQGYKALEDSTSYIEKYNLEIRMARNLYLKALICEKRKQYDEAQELLLSANNIYVKFNYSNEVIRIFILLGKITLKLGAYHSAYSYFQQAEKVFEESDVYNEILIGQVYYYISKTLSKMGVDSKAIEYMKNAEEKLNKSKSLSHYGETFLEVANKRFQEGNLSQAIEYTQKSLSFFLYREQRRQMSELRSGMGSLFSEYGEINKSFEYLSDTEGLNEIVLKDAVVNSLILVCMNYIKLKDDTNAKKILEQIEENIQYIDKADYTLICKYNILKYKVELLEKKYESAESTLLNTLDYIVDVGCVSEGAEVAITLGKFYLDLGKEEEAGKYLDMGVNLLSNTSKFSDF